MVLASSGIRTARLRAMGGTQGDDGTFSGDVTAANLASRGVVDIGRVRLLSVPSDPSVPPGVPAPLGSLALLAGGVGLWQKTAAPPTSWSLITGGGGFVGPGTPDQLAKFTGVNAIGDSQIVDDGTDVGILATTGNITALAFQNAFFGSSLGLTQIGTSNGHVSLTGAFGSIGAYGTVPILQPAGVPQTGPGVHAALVALGFIAAGGPGSDGTQVFGYTVTGAEPDLANLVIALPVARATALYRVFPAQDQGAAFLAMRVDLTSRTVAQFVLSLSSNATTGDQFSFLVSDLV